MRQFDFYEFAGVIVPGTVFLVGAAILAEPIRKLVFGELSVGEATLSVIAAYGIGHLIQALGNLIEWGWWRAWGGIPSDWVRSQRHRLLSEEQAASLDVELEGKLRLKVTDGYRSMSAHAWYSVVRQVYATVASSGNAQRVDIFNGNYGLNRGLAAALLAIAVVNAIMEGRSWKAELILMVGVILALYRMHRFGVHYARELFVQFVQLPGRDATKENRKE